MTERDEYTPSVDEARESYVQGKGVLPPYYTTDHAEVCAERVMEFDRMIEAVRQEERERIAAEINAIRNDPTLIELADKYGGWYQGQRTGLERVEARIREQGKEQDRG